ncbi:DHA2 family efflux MFS transporter permease subunit [Elizabethkingia argentiflava]|uniref:DHA2 family efflux MFS transporter permease subunit n=1 Tax=Elizabethkingia argenteiflava TaxID=2681556 RepID=A0A845PRP7_9FLAO|nr:DHA2 family efflux MFS transporter permease subunit [Elizabethkingia argenteiflava]NAW50872.1 DHA2 family efflux MFS transporter permease subunit [Elizabethkingia argenteiflava]
MDTEKNKNLDEKYKFLPWIAAVAFFMQSLDATILNTALPSIAYDMKRSPLSMQSIIISYILVLALLIPLSGWLSDRFGSKKIFIWAMGIFTFGSLLCACSPSLEFLISSRIIQAIGGSMMVPVSRLAILYTYAKDKLLAIINFITIPGLVGPIIGPTLGGWLVDVTSWHWIFLINIPVGIAGIFFARQYMPNYIMKRKKFDFMGMLLFSGSLLLITISIEFSADKILGGAWFILLFLSGSILMILYYKHFKRTKTPLIDLDLLKIRTLSIGILGNLLTRIGIGGMPLLLPLLFQIGFKYSATVSGIMMIPAALTSIIVRAWATPLVKRLGYRKTLIYNTLLIALVIALFAIPDQNTPLFFLLPLLVAYGGFNSLQMTTMNTLTLADLNNKNVSMGNSLLTIMQQLSMSMGVSISALLLNKYHQIAEINKWDSMLVFRYTFLSMGILTAIVSLIFFRLKNSDGAEMITSEKS